LNLDSSLPAQTGFVEFEAEVSKIDLPAIKSELGDICL
jgi:hypothetical protein